MESGEKEVGGSSFQENAAAPCGFTKTSHLSFTCVAVRLALHHWTQKKQHGICPKKLCGELVETIPSKAQKNGGLGKQIKGQ